jgi:hypothetical protein
MRFEKEMMVDQPFEGLAGLMVWGKTGKAQTTGPTSSLKRLVHHHHFS